MWVRTQDKKTLVNVFNFNIGRVIGDKKHKCCIQGTVFSSTHVTNLGLYATVEDAIIELDRIQDAINMNPNSTYEMN